MQLEDTIKLMKRSDYKDMLAKYKKDTLPFTPKCSYALLNDQLYNMMEYLRTLR